MSVNAFLVSVTSDIGTYRDLRDFNFIFERGEGLFGRDFTYPTAPMPGRVSQARLSGSKTGQPRVASVNGLIDSPTPAQLTTDLRAIVGWCDRAVALKSGHDLTTFLRVDKLTVIPDIPDPQLIQRIGRVRLMVTAEDPRWYSTTLSQITFTTNTQMPLGEAAVGPIIRITGIVSNPTITLKDYTGAAIATLVLTISLPGASDYVEIDCERQTIVKSVASVLSSAADTLSGGDFIELDPKDADTVTPTWPSLSVAYGSGSGTATATFRKAWY
jgi:phage-related protein